MKFSDIYHACWMTLMSITFIVLVTINWENKFSDNLILLGGIGAMSFMMALAYKRVIEELKKK